MAEEEPKIIIDEDWKARVEREREETRRAADKPAEQTPGRDEAGAPDVDPVFVSLVTGLATQAMIALGVLASPDAREVVVDVAQAKHLIDSLMMLRAKMKGNLTPLEEGHLAETVAELQRIYVLRSQQAAEAALKNSGISPQGPRSK